MGIKMIYVTVNFYTVIMSQDAFYHIPGTIVLLQGYSHFGDLVTCFLWISDRAVPSLTQDDNNRDFNDHFSSKINTRRNIAKVQ